MTTYHDDPETDELFAQVFDELREMSPEELVAFLQNGETGPIATLIQASEASYCDGLENVSWSTRQSDTEVHVSRTPVTQVFTADENHTQPMAQCIWNSGVSITFTNDSSQKTGLKLFRSIDIPDWRAKAA